MKTRPAPIPATRWYTPLLRARDYLTRRPALLALILSIASLILSALLASLHGFPVPTIHDEFSYLLAADTYAHGRLTNPPLPHPEFFDTFHILQHPTYMSKYPPGQGLILALGQLLGHPAIGAFLATALMLASFVYLFFAYLPRRWATYASLLAFITVGPLLPWNWSYWGGCLNALGPALALAAVRWLPRRPHWSHGAALSLGISIIAYTRPFEGLALLAPVLLTLLLWLLRSRTTSLPRRLAVTLLPMLVIGTLAAGFLLLSNRAVTGHPLTLPYALHVQQYQVTPLTYFGHLHPEPHYSSPDLRAYWVGYCINSLYPQPFTLDIFLFILHQKSNIFSDFYGERLLGAAPLTPLLLLFLLAPAIRYRRWFILLAAACLAILAANLSSLGYVAHYSAGLLGPLLILLTATFRLATRIRVKHLPVGTLVVAFLTLTYLARFTLELSRAIRAPFYNSFPTPAELAQPKYLNDHPMLYREAIRLNLLSKPGKHLVLVRYPQGWSFHAEWVFNPADLPNEPVLFARDLGGPTANQPLLNDYPDRTIWLFNGQLQKSRDPLY